MRAMEWRGCWRAEASGGWRAERWDPEERRGMLRGSGRWRASERRERWRARGLISWKASALRGGFNYTLLELEDLATVFR